MWAHLIMFNESGNIRTIRLRAWNIVGDTLCTYHTNASYAAERERASYHLRHRWGTIASNKIEKFLAYFCTICNWTIRFFTSLPHKVQNKKQFVYDDLKKNTHTQRNTQLYHSPPSCRDRVRVLWFMLKKQRAPHTQGQKGVASFITIVRVWKLRII